MEEIQFAFRDEKVNIFSMTYGELPGKYSHQIILCKKNPLPKNRKGPFLLDSKRSAPIYGLSEIGLQYNKRIDGSKFYLQYIAYIDAEIKVKIVPELFNDLTSKGFFSVWSQNAPYNYFSGLREGYLVLFRVYQIDEIIDEELLDRGREGRNFYFRLSLPKYVNLICPVITDYEYCFIKRDLIKMLHINNWLLEINEYSTPSINLNKVSPRQIIDDEKMAIDENSSLSPDGLAKKIESKIVTRRIILVESMQYYSDPDVSCYAQKRAAGRCECCGEIAPFKRDDGMYYLETHHLVSLSMGGSDSINNVCAVCPNCHKELHFGVNKIYLREKILKSLNY